MNLVDIEKEAGEIFNMFTPKEKAQEREDQVLIQLKKINDNLEKLIKLNSR